MEKLENVESNDTEVMNDVLNDKETLEDDFYYNREEDEMEYEDLMFQVMLYMKKMKN